MHKRLLADGLTNHDILAVGRSVRRLPGGRGGALARPVRDQAAPTAAAPGDTLDRHRGRLRGHGVPLGSRSFLSISRWRGVLRLALWLGPLSRGPWEAPRPLPP